MVLVCVTAWGTGGQGRRKLREPQEEAETAGTLGRVQGGELGTPAALLPPGPATRLEQWPLAAGSGLSKPQGGPPSARAGPHSLHRLRPAGICPVSFLRRQVTDSYQSPVIGSIWKALPIPLHWLSDDRKQRQAFPRESQVSKLFNRRWRKQNRQEVE